MARVNAGGAVSDENPAVPDEFAVGSIVAGYELEGRIGRGGMAVVYRAHDVRLDRRVALKIMAPGLALDDAFRQRFIRESRAAAAVDHPHIIPVFEAGEELGVLFIAMRYVQGGDVGSLLDRLGALPPRRVSSIIAQVASALDAAHDHGLVHRDVKPANMLLDTGTRGSEADHVYLSDFGLSKQSLATTGLTATGVFLGTLDYVAPEQIEGRPVDGRADQYALACAAFELLSGTPPFRRDGSLAIVFAQLSEPPPALTTRRAGLPDAVDRVMAKAMAKAPDDRYRTCREFAASLHAALGLQRAMTDDQLPAAPPVPQAPVQRPATEVRAPTRPVSELAEQQSATEAAEQQQSAEPSRGATPLTEEATSPGERPTRAGATEPSGVPAYAPPRTRGRRSRIVVLVACVVALGIGGTAYAINRGHGSPPRPPATARALAAPGCDTATAAAQQLGHVTSQTVPISGMPFDVAVAPTGGWSFVSESNGSVEVLRNGSSLAPSVVRTFFVSATSLNGEWVTADGRYLLVAAGSGAYVISIQRAEQGSPNPVVGNLTSPNGKGSIQVVTSLDGRFAFVTLLGSNELAVFNLGAALTDGFGPANFVGNVPLGVAPAGLAISPDGKSLYALSQQQSAGPGPSEGTLTVIDVQRAEASPPTSVVSTVTAGCEATGVITSADGSVVWTSARASDMLLAFSAGKLRTNPAASLIAMVKVGEAPFGMALVDHGRRLVVANSNNLSLPGAASSLGVVSTSAALAGKPALLGIVPASPFPRRMAVTPDGRALLVAHFELHQLQAVDIAQLP
jgi:serine/threonine protein kinase/DNA-binding beta-propeller fold protein YncE